MELIRTVRRRRKLSQRVLARKAGLSFRGWTGSVGPLDRPWFVSGYESVKASALIESPVPFRSRNVFVLANFLERV